MFTLDEINQALSYQKNEGHSAKTRTCTASFGTEQYQSTNSL